MVDYHPDSRFLTDYAAGTLALSEAACVAAHLHYCGRCRARVQQLTDIASHLFAGLQGQVPESAEDQFEQLMTRIDTEPDDGERMRPDVSEHDGDRRLPGVVRALVGEEQLEQLDWVRLGKALRIAPIELQSAGRQTALYDIRAGSRMPEHEHRGEEITVLLQGSFSDADGKYEVGDFVVRHAGEPHQPMATQDVDCLCLVSLERPVRATSFWFRLFEPLINHRLSRVTN